MFQSELKSEIIDELRTLQTQFGLDMVKVNFRDKPKKMAIFVSKYDHCLVNTGSQFVSMFFPGFSKLKKTCFGLTVGNTAQI